MNYGLRNYKITYSRLRRGLLDGFHLEQDGRLVAEENRGVRHCILAALDSNLTDCPWGRLVMKAKLDPDQLLTVRVFASNEMRLISRDELQSTDAFLLDPAEDILRKEKLFGLGEGKQVDGAEDILLYGQKGRYLWIWIELKGHGTAELSDFRVYVPGDNFMETFPEVYRDPGSFFHRYLSIFSTLYNDFQENIDDLHRYIDVSRAPDEILPLLASWVGLQVDGDLLEADELRRLLTYAFPLFSKKGTKESVLQLIHLFVEEEVYVMERNLHQTGHLQGTGELYGDSPFDCVILLNCPATPALRAKLHFLIAQWKPLRARVKLVFLGEARALDAFSYLDINAKIVQCMPAALDDGEALTGMIYLQ